MKTNLIKLVLYDSLAGKTKCRITVAFNIFFSASVLSLQGISKYFVLCYHSSMGPG